MLEEIKDVEKVYDAEDIQMLLKISRSMAYRFLADVYNKQKPFRVIRIGKIYRIPKKEFNDWLSNNDLASF